MTGEKYTCAYCHNTYEKGWTDEESQKEATEIFGKHPDEWEDEQVVICDDCFQKMHPLKSENIDKLITARQQL